ncbi:TonB-dependent receptor [Caulobacter vibrioides]|uniref:TonB-dependent receptor n=1 Tax=Caulobacter vibrioides (strain NA1000 / CB15N) TaxID=565050 RepID=A0A0H3C423_CAUVN|nr:TonB-dependent receptor [Caulobacter vibrioides]YP_002515946.2 TonB-dependent receptor [Caulobacter vibrioides NA1000]ACL94038.2 TonB-dependent receptor [Caulobacter vibrioides NA1000]QXZ53917.1 TonB-dependent receptor [Caulobacter vibrioides]
MKKVLEWSASCLQCATSPQSVFAPLSQGGIQKMTNTKTTATAGRRKAFVIALLSGACFAEAALAQSTPAPAADQAAVDEVVVTAFRKSLATALEVKRKDVRVSDGISSEDIGKFPSENIAEAIQRIPGVQISAINGRGSTISIRGLGPQYALTTVNGQAFKSSNFTDGFRYDVIQTELASGIQVYKSPTADMDAGGLAGTVNIDTVHPFDVKGRQIIVAGKLQQQELIGGNPTGKYGLTYVDHFLDGKLGVFLGGGYQELKDRGDYLWMDRWTVSNNVYTPARLRYRRIDRETKRSMINGAVQWKPTEHLQMDLIGTYAEDKTTQNIHQQVFLFTTPSASNVVPITVANGTSTKVQVNNFRLENNQQYENRPQSTSALTTKLHYTGLENWDFNAVAHYSRGNAKHNEEAAVLGINIPSATVDIADPKNVIFTTSTALTNTAQYAPTTLIRNTYPTGAFRTVGSHESAAQFDAKRYLDWGILESVQVGAKTRSEVLKRYVIRKDNQVVPASFSPTMANSGIAVTNFLDGQMTLPNAWVSPNLDAYREALKAQGISVYEGFDPLGSYRVERDLTSVYAMANLRGEVLSKSYRANIGVRNESTDQTIKGYIGSTANPQNTEVRLAAGNYTAKKSYDNLLPSANLSVDLTDNLLLRVAAAKVLVRPIIDSSNQLARTMTSATDTTGRRIFTISSGQGNLNPMTANQLDLTLEWYYGQGNGLSAGYFSKKVKNGVFSQLTCPTSYESVALSRDSSGVCVAANGDNYMITESFNDSRVVDIHGYEVNWQQSLDAWLPIEGFGLIANYTHVTPAKSTTGFRLANLSEHTANGTVYWENQKFSARLSANYRSAYDQTSVESFFAGPLGHTIKARTQLDLNLGYNFNERLSFAFAAMNINNAQEEAYLINASRWQETAVTGPSYFLSFQYKM